MARRAQRFTIYDMMEQKGVFERNPANADARDDTTGESIYEKQRYPMMFFHPKGQEKITVPAEVIVTPFGPKEVNQQKELIYKIARNEIEERALRTAGWHDHPGKAIRVRLIAEGKDPGEAPPTSAAATIESLQDQLKILKSKLKDAEMASLGLEPEPGPALTITREPDPELAPLPIPKAAATPDPLAGLDSEI